VQAVLASTSTSYTATVTPNAQFKGTVLMSVSGLPGGATGTFNPASITVSGSSTLVVNTTASTPLGNYELTITGTSGTITRSTKVNLVVVGPPSL
jgi:serine protease AprX